MSKIKRKMVFRDLLKQVDRVTVIEFIHHLGIGPIGPAMYSRKYRLVQTTLHALVDDGIVSKLEHGTRVKYELRYRNRETKTREERLFDAWEEVLADRYGWHTFEELQRITGSVTATSINRSLTTPFIAYINDRDRISIRRGVAASHGQRYYIDSDTDDRYAHLKEKIPAHPEIIDEAARRGRSPSVAAAAVEWLETEATQRTAAEKYECTEVAIRQNKDWIHERLETLKQQSTKAVS